MEEETMKYVVMDLEFNMPNTRFRSERNGIRLNSEIIEIGAVRLNEALEQEAESEFSRFSVSERPIPW